MTMHIVGPWLSTTGRSKSKKKFRNAEEARRARELEQDWNSLKSRWGAVTTKNNKNITSVKLPTDPGPPVVRGSNSPKIASLNSWHTGAVSSKPTQQYSGNQVLGVTVVHKSCLQPVFSQQEAIDAAKMRR